MAEVRLAARDVTRSFSSGAGVRGVTLELGAGEVIALVGLNGAGKSTLMRLLLGMLRPVTGEVELDGVSLPLAPIEWWRSVGHSVEYSLAYPELTARQNLRMNARLHGAVDVNPLVEKSLQELGLEEYADRRARALSQGNRQRVGLAAALQHDPSVIVLDEPSNALDPKGVILLREALRRRADRGAAVLVSSHHLDEVARVADRIVVMNAGRLIGKLDPGTPEIERAFFEIVRRDDERASA
ncbi:MAG: ABC transporter ATP-binding protein [Homoserinimonas sp.]